MHTFAFIAAAIGLLLSLLCIHQDIFQIFAGIVYFLFFFGCFAYFGYKLITEDM